MKKNFKRFFVLFLSFVIIALPCVVNAAESNIVTSDDGKSYTDLPAYPTQVGMKLSNGTSVYVRLNAYFLYWHKDEQCYYLVTTDANENSIYKSDDFEFCSNDCNVIRYSDKEMTKKYDTCSSTFFVFRCGVGADSWSWKSSHSSGLVLVDFTEELLQSSANIYSDSSLTDFFIKPTRGLSISGLSSVEMITIMMREVVGLLPLVIGFAVLVMAFWKGYQMLRLVLSRA